MAPPISNRRQSRTAGFAQQLVYNNFRAYSCRNLWDTPAGAFRRGMGYCTQPARRPRRALSIGHSNRHVAALVSLVDIVVRLDDLS